MKKLSSISLLMISLLLAACNKEPTGSKWYEIGDFYDTVTYAEKVPARTIKNKLGVDANTYLSKAREVILNAFKCRSHRVIFTASSTALLSGTCSMYKIW